MIRNFDTNLLYLKKLFPSDENYEVSSKLELTNIHPFLVIVNKNEAI